MSMSVKVLSTALAMLTLAQSGQAGPAGPPLVYAVRAQGQCTLRARTSDFPPSVENVTVTLHAVCRYEPGADRWSTVTMPQPATRAAHRNPHPPTARSVLTDTEIFDLSDLALLHEEPALIAVEWMQGHEQSSAVLACGGMLCNDIDIGPTPAGKIAACLPHHQSAQALFVSDPEIGCYAQFDQADAPRARIARTPAQALERLIESLTVADVAAIRDLTTRRGFVALRSTVPGAGLDPAFWRAWGRAWTQASKHWISEGEILIGPDMKAARAVFTRDAIGWRLDEWNPGM
jgi:hypothetical protein